MNEGLTFQIINEEGKPIECELLSLLPNPEDENSPYIAYTDFDTSKGYKILCGQLVENEEGYTINKIEDDVIIDELKAKISDDMLRVIEENKEALGDE
jgi:hypothetical protein